METAMKKIGIIAPSSPVPKTEFESGVKRLKAAGFSVDVHPQCSAGHLFYAGDAHTRATALLDFANRPDLDVIWCARGGYGAAQMVPLLPETLAQSSRKKLLVGFSDVTSLYEHVTRHWGWSVLHAFMPGVASFEKVKGKDWKNLVSAVRGEWPHAWRFIGKGSAKNTVAAPSVEGRIFGGNLLVMTSQIGTPFAPRLDGTILFLEEVLESPSRIMRSLTQLEQSGQLAGVRGLMVGTLTDCADVAPTVWTKKGGRKTRALLRKLVPEKVWVDELFGGLAGRLGIPWGYGFKVGHGGGTEPLPIGARARFSVHGGKALLDILDWDWLK